MTQKRYIQLYDKDKQMILGPDGVVNFDNRKNNKTALWDLKRNMEMMRNAMRVHNDLKSRKIYSSRPSLSKAVYYVVRGDTKLKEVKLI